MRELVNGGLLDREDGATYQVSLQLWEIGTSATRPGTLRDAAIPFMEDLYVATGQNVQLAVLDGTDAWSSRINRSLARAVQNGKLDRHAADAAAARIHVTVGIDALADRTFVVEAVVEDEAAKVDVFAELDRVVEDQDAILASNTSAIPIMKLGMATSRPEKVVGVHFFNPVPVLKLVELMPSLLTGDKTRQRAEEFVQDTLGKQAIRCQDRAGFVVNALLVPYLLSAIRMMESGYASVADIDAGMVHGCAHPMGPLRLTDLIGLDTTKAIAESMYAEFKEPLHSPPPLLMRMVDAGLLGRKSGRGFYEYP